MASPRNEVHRQQSATEKVCRQCKYIKPLDQFYRNAATPDGHMYFCKPCANEARKRNRHKHRDDATYKQRRNAWKKDYLRRHPTKKALYALRQRLALYGLTEADFRRMLEKQKGLCGLCKRPMGPTWVIDHCHDTEIVRELLCTKCNNGIGMFDEDPALLRLAIQYLEKHQGCTVQPS